ncbi:hypothetical protein Tco_0993017 [Tanacetum coccineum]|uniref:Myb/SANT-like domain-containing protein n=1 Tax=Tanacetum coccineum TaxID=301880 RepID=A0ABQ5F4F8_9ASTR
MVDTNNVDASMVDAAKVKAQVRNKRTWTAEEDQKLIEALMVLHASGKYGAENGFKPGYNQAVQNLLDISIPNSGLKADPHIKSKLKTWRTKFSIMHDMVFGSNTSGFVRVTEKCVLILLPPDECMDITEESCTMLNNSITTMGNEMNMNLSKMANDNERKLESEIELMKKVQNEIDAFAGDHF